MNVVKLLSACTVFFALSPLAASAATVLYQDQLDDPNALGSTWGKNASSSDQVSTFGYNYAADGIPEAPNNLGGAATTGVKMEANLLSPGTGEHFTLYPIGENFTGKYQLRFDAWQNFEDNAGTSTEFMGGGIGYDNVTADIASGAQAIATTEGGSSNDWRAFKSPPQFFIPDPDMAAGTHQGADPYYADFLPSVAAPAAQGQVGGVSTAGSPGFQWITWEFNTDGNDVSVVIEKPDGTRRLIVEYDRTDTSDGSAGVNTDGNISLFFADFFSSVSPRPDLQFGIVDNVMVMTIPEPTSIALLGLGSIGLMLRRRK